MKTICFKKSLSPNSIMSGAQTVERSTGRSVRTSREGARIPNSYSRLMQRGSPRGVNKGLRRRAVSAMLSFQEAVESAKGRAKTPAERTVVEMVERNVVDLAQPVFNRNDEGITTTFLKGVRAATEDLSGKDLKTLATKFNKYAHPALNEVSKAVRSEVMPEIGKESSREFLTERQSRAVA